MKINLLTFYTKNKINLNEYFIKINSKKIGKLVNVPIMEYIDYYLEHNKKNNSYTIYGKIDMVNLNNLIYNNNLLNRKNLFRILKLNKLNNNSNIKHLTLDKLNIINNFNYTTDNYIYTENFGLNLNNDAIINKKEIINKKGAIYGGLIYITSKYSINNIPTEYLYTHDKIKLLLKKILNIGKSRYGNNYNNNSILTILNYENNNSLNLKIVFITYSLITKLNELEEFFLKILKIDFIWIIMDIDGGDKMNIVYQLLNKKRKIKSSQDYINKIHEHCSYTIKYNHNYENIEFKRYDWELNLSNYIKKYTGLNLKRIENIQSIIQNINIDYKIIQEDYTCEICYNNKCNGYIECNYKHMFCEKCYITNYLLNKSCPICTNNKSINWYINKENINKYKFGTFENLKDKPIYINDKQLYDYLSKFDYNIINNIINIDKDIYLYDISEDEKKRILYNTSNKTKLVFLNIN